MPNSEVKRRSADGSVGSPHARVGHCQASIKPRGHPQGWPFCYAQKTGNNSENPSPQPSPRVPTENILNTCVGERELSGSVGEPVPLRQVGTFDEPMPFRQ
jgi:hypothetical protein